MSRAARFSILLLAVLISGSIFASDKKPKSEQVSELHFVVVKQSNGKPIRNASIVLHPVEEGGKQAKGGLQLKTDEEGKTSINAMPFGKIRVQVIAPGMQTFGEDYVVDKPTMEFMIKLSRPTEQYSIYK